MVAAAAALLVAWCGQHHFHALTFGKSALCIFNICREHSSSVGPFGIKHQIRAESLRLLFGPGVARIYGLMETINDLTSANVPNAKSHVASHA